MLQLFGLYSAFLITWPPYKPIWRSYFGAIWPEIFVLTTGFDSAYFGLFAFKLFGVGWGHWPFLRKLGDDIKTCSQLKKKKKTRMHSENRLSILWYLKRRVIAFLFCISFKFLNFKILKRFWTGFILSFAYALTKFAYNQT